MTSFGYRKHKKNKIKLYDNILDFKVHFESKVTLMQQLNEQDWIKSMYIKDITYIISMAIKPHVCDSWNITKQKKIEKKCNFHL